jgi:hypothetical protein
MRVRNWSRRSNGPHGILPAAGDANSGESSRPNSADSEVSSPSSPIWRTRESYKIADEYCLNRRQTDAGQEYLDSRGGREDRQTDSEDAGEYQDEDEAPQVVVDEVQRDYGRGRQERSDGHAGSFGEHIDERFVVAVTAGIVVWLPYPRVDAVEELQERSPKPSCEAVSVPLRATETHQVPLFSPIFSAFLYGFPYRVFGMAEPAAAHFFVVGEVVQVIDIWSSY